MNKYSIALDIGTTNISSALIDIDAKRIVSSLDKPNEQAVYGADVITRLKFAATDNGIKELNKKLMHSVDSVVKVLIARAGIRKTDVTTILAVGNAAMYHLTFLLPVETLACAPFSPAETRLMRRKASSVGLEDFSESEFVFLPNMGGFVGSDAIGVILALDMHKEEGVKLAVDLGTNGEVILGNNEKILVSSTAAGPAFEGWHITPKGITASDLIKIISALVEEGRIDKTGRFTPEASGVCLNQKDIREIQLAKSAIRTAVSRLRSNYGIGYEDVKEVAVTGKFGGSLNKEDLIKIGIVPPGLKEKNFSFAENLALKGVSLLLLEDRMNEVDFILKIAKHIELHKEEKFQEEFAKGLRFN